jgi:hypothetical protein
VHNKSLLLNQHISTIQQHLTNCKSDFDVLIGIQAFFHNNEIQGEKCELKFVVQMNVQKINLYR